MLDQQQRDLTSGSGDRAGLLNHVYAIAVILDHPAKPAHLTFYAIEALDQVLLLLG